MLAAATVATWIVGNAANAAAGQHGKRVRRDVGGGVETGSLMAPEAARTTVPVVTTLSTRMLSGRTAALVRLPMVRSAAAERLKQVHRHAVPGCAMDGER